MAEDKIIKDKQVQLLIDAEKKRQQNGIELIPSENYVSEDVLTALGSVFTNKYSEGYPHRRYYGGQENTDQLETIAIERAKKLFGADHANVQPHSGAQANEAVYYAWCNPGDMILAMNLSHGGHLTHGHPVTILAKQFNFVRYGIKDISTGEIDYKGLQKLALKYKPKIILAGFSSYPRELDYEKFAAIGQEVGALMVADMSHLAGLIAAKVASNPFDYGFHVITTTTHKTLRGPRGGLILSKGIVSNPLKSVEHTIDNIPTLIDRTVFPGLQGGPHMHTIAAKAVALREAMQPEFKTYAAQVLKNAKALSLALEELGCEMITGGTDNHLLLVNVKKSFGIDGEIAQQTLEKVGITVNKNVIPDDILPAFSPSGIRLGTPAITTRGFKEKDMANIASLIVSTIRSRDDDAQLAAIASSVEKIVNNR